MFINPLNTELNLICHLLALVAHPIFHVSRIRVNTQLNIIHIFFSVSQVGAFQEVSASEFSTLSLYLPNCSQFELIVIS